MKKIGISIFDFQNKYGDIRALEIAKEIGADAVDVNLASRAYEYRNENSVYSKSDEEIIAHFSKIKAKADELGIEVCQTHGRMSGFRNDKAEDEAVVENSRRDLLATSVLGAPVCVVHNCNSVLLGPDAPSELMHRLSFELFTSIIPFAKQYGVKVATETFGDAEKVGCCDFFGYIQEFIKTYNNIRSVGDNAEYFTICADTGHSNKAVRYDNPSAADVIRMCGKDVTVLHLNDNDGMTDQHKILGTGNIDWKDVFDALDEIGYKGVYNMELKLTHFGRDFEIEEAAFAIKVIKNLLKDR